MNDMVQQISIHAALVDTNVVDKHIIEEKAQQDLIKEYFAGGLFKKMLHFFADKEIKQYLQEKHQRALQAETQKNTFFHPERTAFAHRSNIAFRFGFTDSSASKPTKAFSDTELTETINNYILGEADFSQLDMEAAEALFVTKFDALRKNNRSYKTFVQKHTKKNQKLTSDILILAQAYKANVILIKKIQENSDYSLDLFRNDVNNFVSRYQQLPLFMRMLQINHVSQATFSTLMETESLENIQQLIGPIYAPNLSVIPASKASGSYALQKSPYSSISTRIGMIWKSFPWWLKIILMGGIIGLTAFAGGWALIALPIIVLIKQFCKTKADYLQSVQSYLGRFMTHNEQEKLRKTYAQKKKKLTKQQKDTYMVYNQLQPSLLDSPIYARTLASNIIEQALRDPQGAELKQAVDSVLAHVELQRTLRVPSLAVQHTQYKEQELLLLYKALIFGASMIGYDMAKKSTKDEYSKASGYQETYKKVLDEVKKSRIAYHRHTRKFALRDGIMSGIIV